MADAALYWVKQNGRDGWSALRPTARTNYAEMLKKLHLGAQAMLDSERLVLTSSRQAAAEVTE